ncbi:MAG: hypothetical protein IKT46_04045 [Clostridia bacterium]|nr:hypothetical protein [Clostridia bacterium]
MKKIFAILMVVVMLFAIAIPVSAEISPKPQPDVDISVVPEKGGEITEKDNGDGTITITVKPNSGYDFVKWELTGEYEIVSGKLTDKTITIKPITDVKAQAVMKTQTTVKPTPGPGTSSPSTGVAPAMMVVAFVGSMAAAGYSFKKSSK